MAKHKVIDLINQFMEDHGQSSGKDRVMLWLEDVYSKIRRMPWSWNFTQTEDQTGGRLSTTPIITSVITYDDAGAVVLASTETFTWTTGTSYIQSTLSTVSCVNQLHTGRYIYLGDEWYKCIRISPAGIRNKIYLDRKIVAPSQAVDPDTGLAKQMSFYRRDLSLKTNGIKSIHVDSRKIENITSEQIYRFKRGLDPRWYYGDSGEPLGYHIQDSVIAPPKFAPLCIVSEDPSAASAGLTEGTHRAFFTFIDPETGYESSPGPSVDFEVKGSRQMVQAYYDNDGDGVREHWHEESTYLLGVYISTAIDTYTRVPMHSIKTSGHYGLNHDPDEFGSVMEGISYSKSDSELKFERRYYDGEWTNVCFYPAPDEYLRAHARHIDTWEGLPGESDQLKLGRQREFIDLFHLYFLMKQSIQNKDPAQFRQMQGSFREQLNFLLAQDGDDRRLDPSSWEYKFYSPTSAAMMDEEFTASLKYPF
jgi:hypothetical protein